MDRIKLKWRIFAYLLAFCGLLLGLLWLFQTVLLSDTYKLIRKTEVNDAILQVQENINKLELVEIFENLQMEKQIYVTLTTEFDETFSVPLTIKRGGEAIQQTKVFTLSNGQKISLTFYALITPVDSTVETIKVQLYIISFILILLSVILAIVIAKRISKPIEEINKSAKTLAKGNYDALFDGKGFLEITELSTTLNKASTELSKVDKMRRELMANISHDLRTPLSLIYSYAELMSDFPDEITPEQPQVIMDEAKRLSSLVNDVLDLSRLENGDMQLNKTEYNLTSSISQVVERISSFTKERDFKINFHKTQDVNIVADETKITQVVYNLLINAINYSGESNIIDIIQQSDDDSVKIIVKDYGEGIAPENIDSIWDRYYKVDKVHKRGVMGTGLGLSIVKKILLLHDGEYGVESQLNQGSSFWFVLKK